MRRADPPPRRGAFSGPPPLVSVVIPTHEGAAPWLRETLHAVAAQRVRRREIVLVFDGDAPRTSSLARGILPVARQLHLDEQRGFAHAASRGLAAARAPLVALLNDDAVPQEGWLEALLAGAEAWPQAGSFACRVLQLDAPGVIDSAGHGLTRWGEAFALGHGLADGPDFDAPRRVFGPVGSAAAYRRELLQDCGLFDEGMEAYLEDVELSLRAQLMGFPCRYLPDARVVHRGSASYGWGGSSGRAERLVARNRWRLLGRAMPRRVLRAAGPAVLASLGLELAARALRGRHVGAVAAGTLEGLRGLGAATRDRPGVLGGRRIDDAALAQALRDAEGDLLRMAADDAAGPWRRARGRVTVALAAWVDRRERRMDRAPYPW